MNDVSPVLTLLGRDGCQLCEEMRAGLHARTAPFPIELVEIDIAVKPELEARYGWDIPVLLAGEREICRHFLDEQALQTWLSEQGIFL
jgi:Glutaredoxin-like domain (DUF836)